MTSSSSSSIILFTASCSLVLLSSSGTIRLGDALLITSSQRPSLRRTINVALRQYRHIPESEYEYGGYHQDGARNPQLSGNSNPGQPVYYADSTGQYVESVDGEVGYDEVNDYIESRRVTRGNGSKKEEKSSKFSDSINEIFSKVFLNQQQKLQPHLSHPKPVSPRTIPNLPRIKISNEDIEKFTNQAKAGGTFVSNLMKEAFVHTAKLAIDAIEKSNVKMEMEPTAYTDVCEFDDDLCREIEDALEATNSFKKLVEDSNISMPSDSNTRIVERDDKRMDLRSENVKDPPHADIADKYFTVKSASDNASVVDPHHVNFKSERDMNITGNHLNKFEQYYKLSLEQQLSEFDERKPRDVRQTRDYLNDSGVKPRGHTVVSPHNRLDRQDKMPPPRADEAPLIERRSKGWADSSDYRRKPGSRSNTGNEFGASGSHQISKSNPSSPIYQVESIQDQGQNNTRIKQGRDAYFSPLPEKRSQSQLDKESFVEKDRKRLVDQGDYKPKLRSIIEIDADVGASDPIRERPRDMPNRGRSEEKKLGFISNDEYDANVPVKVADEAVAFVRSLNLDVYEIYLSMQNPGSDAPSKGKGEAVVTLDDVIWYCERMQVGPRSRHRSAPSLARFNTGETGYTGANTAMASGAPMAGRNPRLAERGYHYNTKDRVYSGHRESTYSVASERRQRGERIGETNPKAKPQHVANEGTILTERVPRFRQYPEVESSGPLRPSVRNDARDTRAAAPGQPRPTADLDQSVQSLGGIRHEAKSKSSMSQLIDSDHRRRHERGPSSRDHARRYSSVPLAQLIQKPRVYGDIESDSHLPFDQVSTNSFREPWSEVVNKSSNRERLNYTTSLQYHSEHTPSMPYNKMPQQHKSNSVTASTRDNESAYCTNDALLMAEKWNVDLRKVAAGSDEAITADDVRHYIESRKHVRATRRQQDVRSTNKSSYIDNELTYEEFSAYFDDTLNSLHQKQTAKIDPSEMIE